MWQRHLTIVRCCGRDELSADGIKQNVPQCEIMALPVKTNQAATTGERQENDLMENQTLTIEQVTDLAANLSALPKDANQNQLAEAIADATLIQIAAVSLHGDRISGSAERAVAAWLNNALPVNLDRNWFEVEYREKTEMAKALQPQKTELFAAWKKAASTKWGRVRGYAEELAEPALRELIEAVEDEELREEYYDQYGLLSPKDVEAGVQIGEEATTTSKNRDLYERSVCEIGKLYRALNASDNDAVIKAHAKRAQIVAALEHITSALTALDAPIEDEDLAAFMKAIAKR